MIKILKNWAKQISTHFRSIETPEKMVPYDANPAPEKPSASIANKIVYIDTKKPLNILVCENEKNNQKIITQLLSISGSNIKVVENSDEMLDSLETQQFDLVITASNLTGISGIDAVKFYRFTQPTDSETRFILLTGNITQEVKQEANNAGFDSILTKPIDVELLFNEIEQALALAPNTAMYWMGKMLDASKPTTTKIDLAVESSVLDMKTLFELEKISAGDELFMHRLLKNYLADSLKIIYSISDSLKQRRYAELIEHCHALKGNSLSIGAIQLANTIENLSKINSADSREKTHAIVGKLNSDFSTLTLAVEDYLRKPQAASK